MKESKTTQERLSEILEDSGIRPEFITDEALLREDLGIDSLDHVEIGMQIEEEFDIDIPDGDLWEADTVGKMKQLIDRLSAVEAE